MNTILCHRPPERIKEYAGHWWRRYTRKHRVVIEFYNEISDADLKFIEDLLPKARFARMRRLSWRAEVRKGALPTFVHVTVWGPSAEKVQQNFVAALQAKIAATRGGMA